MHARLDVRFIRALFAGLDAQAEGHVVKHGHVPEQRVVLEDKAHAALAHVDIGRVLAAKEDLPRVGAFQPGDDAQQRGFAAARRPQQRHQFAAADVQADVAQGLEVAELLADVLNVDAHGCFGCVSASGHEAGFFAPGFIA
jgi:phenol 2-monooxygenase